MEKILLIFIQLLFSITLFAQTYKSTSTNLNLRSGPSTSYQILATIPMGTSVKIAENCDCVWIKIYYNGQIGYVSSKYLSNTQMQNTQNSKTYQQNTHTSNSYSSPGASSNSKKTTTQTRTNYYNNPASGATALCRDGTYSYSQNRRGSCSHHGGVARWLR